MHLYSYTKALALSVLFSIVSVSSVFSMELIAAHSISSAEPVRLLTNHRDIFVEDENAAYRVEKYNVNPLLREVVNRKALGEFKNAGRISVKKLSDGKYILAANVNGDGGFLLTGVVVYQGCRVVGYSGLVLASASTIVAAAMAGGPVAGAVAASQVIQASGPAAAAIESSSLAIGTAASWIPWLP